MTVAHGRPLQLAAASIDFPLRDDERDELRRHLAECPDCRRAADAMRHQAIVLRERPRAVPTAATDARIAVTWQRTSRRGVVDDPFRLVLILAMVVLLVLAAVGIGAGLRRTVPQVLPTPGPFGGGPLPAVGAATTFYDVVPGSTPHGCAMIPESQCATAVLLAFDSVWATRTDGVTRAFAATGTIRAVIDVGAHPVRMLATDDALFVSVGGTGKVVRVDPASNRVTDSLDIGPAPGALAVADGLIWVLEHTSRSIVRVDPATMTVVDRTPVDFVPWSIATTSRSVWVTDRWGAKLHEFDPRTAGPIRTIEVPDGKPAGSMDFGAGVIASGDRLWVADSVRVWSFDPGTGQFAHGVAPPWPEVAVHGDAMWVVGGSVSSLQRWDPDTLEPVAEQQFDMPWSQITNDWEFSVAADDDAVYIWSYRGFLVRVATSPAPSGPVAPVAGSAVP
jgi:glutamine cyclotransferase